MHPAVKKWLGFLVRAAVSVGLMALIAYMIQFRDQLELSSGVTLSGKIVGEQPEHVRFEPIDGPERVVPHSELARDENGNLIGIKPGFLTIFRRIERVRYGFGFGLIILCYIIGSVRWWLLLRSQSVDVSLWQAVRWTYVGVFFNNFLPGSTGGDVVKAIYVARETHAKTRGVVSVFVDRAIGLIALIMLGGIVCLFNLDQPQYRQITYVIFAILACGAGGATVVFSTRIRRLLRFDQLIAKLPLQHIVQEVDGAILMYRDHKRVLALVVLLGLAGHGCLVGSHYFFGVALGIDQPASTFYVLVPIALLATAVPIAVQGWGVGEGVIAFLFAQPGIGVSPARAVGMSITYRLSTILFSVFGGVFLLGSKSISADEVSDLESTSMAQPEADAASPDEAPAPAREDAAPPADGGPDA